MYLFEFKSEHSWKKQDSSFAEFQDKNSLLTVLHFINCLFYQEIEVTTHNKMNGHYFIAQRKCYGLQQSSLSATAISVSNR